MVYNATMTNNESEPLDYYKYYTEQFIMVTFCIVCNCGPGGQDQFLRGLQLKISKC